MQQLLCSLWREEDGQDLIEYSLLNFAISEWFVFRRE